MLFVVTRNTLKHHSNEVCKKMHNFAYLKVSIATNFKKITDLSILHDSPNKYHHFEPSYKCLPSFYMKLQYKMHFLIFLFIFKTCC